MNCLYCNYEVDAHAVTNGPPESTPRPNDLTFCISCGEAMAFDDDLQFRKLTDEERVENALEIKRNQNIIELIKSLD